MLDQIRADYERSGRNVAACMTVDKVDWLIAEVVRLRAEMAATCFILGEDYSGEMELPDKKRRPLDSLVSEALAQKDNELAEYVEEAFQQIAFCEKGEMAGWWDSMADSTACSLGDRLVKLGTWEKHPTMGTGRRQWYRPIKSAAEAEQVQGATQ